MSQGQKARVFGRRQDKHILILASGERIRHMTIEPWMAATAIVIGTLFVVGYLMSTTYLVLRDDLIGGTMARQARMQHEYEDRIAALRAQVDRITSRQLLDQQIVEEKVDKLIEQQMALANRHGKLGSLLERAENSGLETDAAAPAADDKPKTDDRADAAPLTRSIDPVPASLTAFADDRDGSIADRADRLFANVTRSIKTIERQQLAQIETLALNAGDRADTITRIVRNTGVPLSDKVAALETETGQTTDIGGPYVEPERSDRFDASLTNLDLALDRLERVRAFARDLPFANPAPGRTITSLYGNRLDPFFGKRAMHTGIDFRLKTGGEVRTTGTGKVIHAGTAGGYGLMVEIDHGNGITTRYGHLSRLLVKEGDEVQAGALIALSGSTGRSTGPHLHYEVRKNGIAIDPMRFLNAGLKLTRYLD